MKKKQQKTEEKVTFESIKLLKDEILEDELSLNAKKANFRCLAHKYKKQNGHDDNSGLNWEDGSEVKRPNRPIPQPSPRPI